MFIYSKNLEIFKTFIWHGFYFCCNWPHFKVWLLKLYTQIYKTFLSEWMKKITMKENYRILINHLTQHRKILKTIDLTTHISPLSFPTLGVGVHWTQQMSLNSCPAWIRRGRRPKLKSGRSSLGFSISLITEGGLDL